MLRNFGILCPFVRNGAVALPVGPVARFQYNVQMTILTG